MHFDKKYFAELKRLIEENKMILEDIRILTQVAGKICNDFRIALIKEEKALFVYMNDNAKYIFEDIKFAKGIRENKGKLLI